MEPNSTIHDLRAVIEKTTGLRDSSFYLTVHGQLNAKNTTESVFRKDGLENGAGDPFVDAAISALPTQSRSTRIMIFVHDYIHSSTRSPKIVTLSVDPLETVSEVLKALGDFKDLKDVRILSAKWKATRLSPQTRLSEPRYGIQAVCRLVLL